MPPSSLPARDAVSLWRAVPAGLAIPARRADARCVLRVACSRQQQSRRWHSGDCCSTPSRRQTPWPANASEYTAFAVRFWTGKGLDLTRAPFNRDAREVDASHRLHALPGPCRYGAERACRRCDISRRVRPARTSRCWRARHSRRASRWSSSAGAFTSAPPAPARSASSRGAAGLRSRRLRPRSAHRRAALGPST